MSSAADQDKDLNTSLLKELECPICFQHCTPPIFTCPESHSVCLDCLGQITKCPICRGPKPTIRNRLAETMCTKVRFPCRKNGGNGCTGMYTLKELEVHLPTCDFRCRCYAGTFECTWRGKRADLFDHVTSVHPLYLGSKASFTVEYQLHVLWEKLCGTLSNLCAAHAQLFWVRMFYEQDRPSANYYCFSAICVGSEDTASRYRCEFLFASEDNSFENILRVPVNYEHNPKNSSPENDCIRLSDTFLKHFIHNDVLRCKVTILEK